MTILTKTWKNEFQFKLDSSFEFEFKLNWKSFSSFEFYSKTWTQLGTKFWVQYSHWLNCRSPTKVYVKSLKVARKKIKKLKLKNVLRFSSNLLMIVSMKKFCDETSPEVNCINIRIFVFTAFSAVFCTLSHVSSWNPLQF